MRVTTDIKPLIEAPGYCAPSRIGHYKKTGSCLVKDELALVADAYNSSSPKDPIVSPKTKGVRELQEELHKRIKKVTRSCNGGDHCIMALPAVKSDSKVSRVIKESFRPEMPKTWEQNDHLWLNTFDIEDVMCQYTDANSSFEFLGVFPVDFNTPRGDTCISHKLCNVPKLLSDLKARGKTEFGVVINLDRHDQSGSHWVAVYACFDAKRKVCGIHYYDSVGNMPPPSVRKFMKDVKALTHCEKFHKKVNKDRRQYKNSECGVFSMLFIIMCMHHGDKMNLRQICKHIYKDDGVHAHRKLLYRPAV